MPSYIVYINACIYRIKEVVIISCLFRNNTNPLKVVCLARWIGENGHLGTQLAPVHTDLAAGGFSFTLKKVPTAQVWNFPSFGFHDFYTIKSLQEGDNNDLSWSKFVNVANGAVNFLKSGDVYIVCVNRKIHNEWSKMCQKLLLDWNP
jgi:hypothetical protein